MQIYYKTERGSETGKKFGAVLEKVKQVNLEIESFLDGLGASQNYLCQSHYFVGGLVGIYFNNRPNMEDWKEVRGKYGFYYPRAKSAIGKALLNQITEFRGVKRHELDSIVGLNSVFESIGFSYNNTEFFGFVTGHKFKVSIPEDCTEITGSEYALLFGEN